MTSTKELLRIDRTIEIKASQELVWRALTDPAQLGAWFKVSVEGEIALGKEVWMTSQHAGPCEGKRFSARISEFNPITRLAWQWHPGVIDSAVDYSREPRTTVTFTLEPSKGGTRLSVAETGFDEISVDRRAKVFGDNDHGWSEVLVWLQQYAEAQS